jgi:hypothetical protein
LTRRRRMRGSSRRLATRSASSCTSLMLIGAPEN